MIPGLTITSHRPNLQSTAYGLLADFINAAPKYVVTSTPLTGQWNNAHAVSGTLREIVPNVKSSTDHDVGGCGAVRVSSAFPVA